MFATFTPVSLFLHFHLIRVHTRATSLLINITTILTYNSITIVTYSCSMLENDQDDLEEATSTFIFDCMRMFYVAIVNKLIKFYQVLVIPRWCVEGSTCTQSQPCVLGVLEPIICSWIDYSLWPRSKWTSWCTRRWVDCQLTHDSQLSNNTLQALLSCKINMDEPCYVCFYKYLACVFFHIIFLLDLHWHTLLSCFI